ncbi:unnamed protein product [Rotaria sordida]|uniref:Uncharacterized protein n=1 Tax=Rotaria sordida TaxID=392033 RepID=A0A814XY46_9BILA|nr:unnamed protein product [Rotaria sordida]CAF1118459.1 unnamed protein product [Rotaria sordida]CAF1206001.1 unnamed protein product [Rotaria sordida]CAF1206515.1 unnamed protein product [Rotaria sordida]CAF1222033.1 unnamed protein product [Rotaria sordida]
MAFTISSPTRRVHYQSQIYNNPPSLSHSLSIGESTNLNESFSSSFISSIPLITIIYSNSSLSKGTCTFIRLIYGENQQLLLNSYASCHRLLDHIKPIIGIQHDEIIDLMDNEGKLKELHTHGDEYASQYLTGRNTYYVLKVENDTAVGEKRYIPNFNLDQIDQKIYSILTTSLNSLNKSANKTKRPTGASKQNTPTQITSNTTQSKTKRTSNRK